MCADEALETTTDLELSTWTSTKHSASTSGHSLYYFMTASSVLFLLENLFITNYAQEETQGLNSTTSIFKLFSAFFCFLYLFQLH